MNSQKIVILLTSFILIIGCKDDSLIKAKWAQKNYGKQILKGVKHINASSDSLIEINIKDDDLEKIVELSDFISEFNYVPLETTKNNLIGLIDRLIVKENRVYVLDQFQSKSIFTYDWNGKLISSINKKGRGPGEYNNLRDIAISDDKGIFIYDSAGKKIIKYNEKAELIFEKKINLSFSYFTSWGNDNFIYSTNFSSQNYHLPQIHCNNLIFSGPDLKIKKIALPYDKKNLLLRVANGPDFFENNDLKFYHPYLSDTIYQIKTDKNVLAKYVIGFEGKVYSRNKLKDKSINSTDDGFVFNRQERKEAKYLLHPFTFSNRVDYFSFSNMDKGIYNIFYDKKTNRVYSGNKFNFNNLENVFVFNSPQAGYKNYLIGFVNASVFVKGWKAFKKTVSLDGISKDKIELYDSVKFTDNPVLFFAKTK